MNRLTIEDQILALLDGDLSAEEAASLEGVLRDYPDALQTYVKLVDLHNALETRFARGRHCNKTPLIAVDRIMVRQRRRIARMSLLAAAALLLGVAVIMALILAPSAPPQVATFRTTADSRYSLSYEGEGEAPRDGQLAVGSRLLVSEGAFEGKFSNGVRLVAEAPCDLRILAEDRVAIDLGAAWFRVPAEGKGFVAETPGLAVVDLGTEFGVISRPGMPDEVHVIAGLVEATARSENGTTENLKAGMARRVQADGRLHEIDPDPSLFRKRLDDIAHFTFTGPPWTTDKENDFATFAAKAPSEDTDRRSTTSPLANSGFTAGRYDSFYMRDSDTGKSIFSTSATPGNGMNVGGANQPVPTHYLSFTVTPDAGYQTVFESLSFYTGAYGANSDYFIELRASDGATERLLGSISHATGASQDQPVAFRSIDFEDFSSEKPIEFRIYVYGLVEPEGRLGNTGIRFDDIVLKGGSEPVSPRPAPAD
jgi:ferric-dicitrate binding protein FerR (iron transport regulator)